MIIRIILIVIIALFLCFFIFKDNSLKRNVSALWSLGIIAVCVIVLFFLIFGLIKKYKGIGEGALFTDMISAETQNDNAAEEEKGAEDPAGGSELTIRINLDTVYIGTESYADAELIRPVINEAAKNGNRVILVDDYATADTYLYVKDLLNEAGITDFTEEPVD